MSSSPSSSLLGFQNSLSSCTASKKSPGKLLATVSGFKAQFKWSSLLRKLALYKILKLSCHAREHDSAKSSALVS